MDNLVPMMDLQFTICKATCLIHVLASKLMQHEKVHPFDSQENPAIDTDKPKTCLEIQEIQEDNEALAHFNQAPTLKIQAEKQENYTSFRCLKEVLMESQSNTPTSVNSCCSYYLEEDEEEVIVLNDTI